MRAILATFLLLATAIPLAAAHEPFACSTNRPFPTLDMRVWRPGDALVYYVPGGQFATVTSAGPIDVSMAIWGTCNATGCDHHAAIGTTACATDRLGIVEIANRGAGDVAVTLAIGACVVPGMCAPLGSG